MNPYLAVVFANRNDEYTSDQRKRISAFIDYYAYYDKMYPGLFEFIICDWNPPEGKQSLKDAYFWDRLSLVTHIIVPKKIHQKLCPDQSRPILDYTARNVCIRKARAPFILVINQDIFLSSSILDFLAKRNLSSKHFYRSDRCDFLLDYEKSILDWGKFDQYAAKNAIRKHIRPDSDLKPKSIDISEESFDQVYTRKRAFEKQIGSVIYSDFYTVFRKGINISYWVKKWIGKKIEYYHETFCLHTNASGDFFIVPKKAFYKIHGFVETHLFYMHLDAYFCFQLLAAGYKQAILTYPHTVFHSDHSRSSREGRPEAMTLLEHSKVFDEICLNQRSYQFNPKTWGLLE